MGYRNDEEHLAAIDRRLRMTQAMASGRDEPNWWELDVKFLRQQLAAAQAQVRALQGPPMTPRDLLLTPQQQLKLLSQLLYVEQTCPCGARPENLHTHPHIGAIRRKLAG